MKVKDFLNKDNWTKGHMARDRFGKPCGATDSEACCWCVLGAVNICYAQGPQRDEAIRLICDNLPNNQRIIGFFNDLATWEQVEEILRKADV